MNISSAIDEAADAADFGTPSARKTGRDPRWPYVPVLEGEVGPGRQRQLLGLAFATRAEAVAAAEEHVAREREILRRKLAEPRYRALRQWHGLPADL